MILGKLGTEVAEDFSVINEDESLVTGIDSSTFIIHLFDPDGNLDSTSVISIIELGYGHYRIKYIPNRIGIWYMVAYHNTYFPLGKSGSIQVFANDFDSITTLITRILGLTQENFFIDNTSYDSNSNMTSSRIRIYSDSLSVGTSNNIIATYNMNATYSGNNMVSYKVEKQ